MDLLQFSGTSIYLFCLSRNPVRDNLILSPFSDLKELISQNRYKTLNKAKVLCQNMKLLKRITQES